MNINSDIIRLIFVDDYYSMFDFLSTCKCHYSFIWIIYKENVFTYKYVINKLYFDDLDFSPNSDNQLMNKFIANYEGKYNKKATTYAATGYDAVYLAKQAIEQSSYDGIEIKKYLYNVNYTGATGHIVFDKNGDNVGVTFAIYQLDSLDNSIIISK